MSKQPVIKTIQYIYFIRMLNLSLKELELKAKNRGFEGYKTMSIDKLFRIFDAPEPIKENKPIRDIRK